MNANFLFPTIKKAIFVILLFFVIAANAIQSKSNVSKNHPIILKNDSFLKDELLVLNLDFVDSKKLLRVSFNGNEGTDGELKIYDEKNVLVTSSNFELIKSPFYATVDVTALSTGTYLVVLVTNSGSHKSNLQIK
ncbi:hypothetical protein MCEGE10_00856 [Flavobacteriaceae bacterium]